MAVEIERKFLVHGHPWHTWNTGTVYQQGYLAKGRHAMTRVRVAGAQGYLTIKGKTEGISRLEFEYQIPHEDALALLQLCESRIISKTRYLYVYEGHTWEVDVFNEDNEGLVLAEIELQTADEPFQKPSWLGAEVSHDPRYFNSSLSKNPWSHWNTLDT